MFKEKHYVADCVKDGDLVGHVRCSIKSWNSPMVAIEVMSDYANRRGYDIVNIRRIK